MPRDLGAAERDINLHLLWRARARTSLALMRAAPSYLPPVILRLILGSLLLQALLQPNLTRAADSTAGTLVTHGPTSGKKLALTFDDGPAPATEKVLELLRRHNVHATFFVLGEQVQRRPAMLKQVVEAGHEVQSHTFDHQNYAALLKTTTARVIQRGGTEAEALEEVKRTLRDDFRRTRDLIEQNSGVRPGLCRMPNGIDRPWIKEIAKEMGITLVNWTYGADWNKGSAKDLLPGYLAAIKPGAILLFHDGRNDASTSLKLVEAVIADAKKQGYEIVTVSQLLQPR
jgi:peptidoglycan/xylan/chitin deacetylase (PgdA/CDA1 family)